MEATLIRLRAASQSGAARAAGEPAPDEVAAAPDRAAARVVDGATVLAAPVALDAPVPVAGAAPAGADPGVVAAPAGPAAPGLAPAVAPSAPGSPGAVVS